MPITRAGPNVLRQLKRAASRRRGQRGRANPQVLAARRAALAIPPADSAAALLRGAEQNASKMIVDQRAADYLFKKSRCAGISRKQWENEIRLTTAIYMSLRRSRKTLPWEQVVDFA